MPVGWENPDPRGELPQPEGPTPPSRRPDDTYPLPAAAETPLTHRYYPDHPTSPAIAELRALIAEREAASRERHTVTLQRIEAVAATLATHIADESPGKALRRQRGLMMVCITNFVLLALLSPAGSLTSLISEMRTWDQATWGFVAVVLGWVAKEWFGLSLPPFPGRNGKPSGG